MRLEMTVSDFLKLASSCTKWVIISDKHTGNDIIAINPQIYDRRMLSDEILDQTVCCIGSADEDVLEITVCMIAEKGGVICEN